MTLGPQTKNFWIVWIFFICFCKKCCWKRWWAISKPSSKLSYSEYLKNISTYCLSRSP